MSEWDSPDTQTTTATSLDSLQAGLLKNACIFGASSANPKTTDGVTRNAHVADQAFLAKVQQPQCALQKSCTPQAIIDEAGHRGNDG